MRDHPFGQINYKRAQARHDRYYRPVDRAISRANDLALQVFMKALVLAAIALLLALVAGAVV